MSKPLTSMSMQSMSFLESLHTELKKQASADISDNKKYIKLASAYLTDGLEVSECVELLMIDGLSRGSAESLTLMAQNNENIDAPEYSFQFEDSYGRIHSSYEVGRTVRASSEEEAWRQAEVIASELDEEPKILSINRL